MLKREETNFRFFGALLLLQMPNLEKLDILYYDLNDTIMFPILALPSTIQLAQPSLEQAPYSFSRLRELSITNCSSGISEVSKLVQLLQMPTLREFTTDGLESSGFIHHDFGASQIRRLTLSKCFVPLATFSTILRNCQYLTTLRISYYPEEIQNSLPDLTILVNSIHHLQNSLEHLHFVKCGFEKSPRIGPFPSLAQFQKLRILSINGDAFVIPNGSTCRAGDFSDLPPNLEQLLIRNPGRAQITYLLSENIRLLSHVPKLKGIHIEIHVDIKEDGTWIRIPMGGYHPSMEGELDFATLSEEYAKHGVRLSYEFGGFPYAEHTGGRRVYVYDIEGDERWWRRALMRRHIDMVTRFAVDKIATQSLEISLSLPPSGTYYQGGSPYYTEDNSD